jgi:hypothetical protein
MKTPILLLILLITLTSCKEDKKTKVTIENGSEITKEIVQEENVIITLNAVVPNDDTFTLQFTEDEAFSFEKKDQVKTKITGSNVAQNISFKLPNKVIPTKIMLRVGLNNKENVDIKGITFNNEEREFKVSENNFFQFLVPNKFIDYNRETNTYTAKKVDDRFSPTFVSRRILIQRLEEWVY